MKDAGNDRGLSAELLAQIDPGVLLELVRSLPAAVFLCDRDGRIVFYNAGAVRLWGREPELGAEHWCGAWRTYRLDGRPLPLDEGPVRTVLRGAESGFSEELVVERPDGSRRQVRAHPALLSARNGDLLGVITLLVDVTEQRQADMARGRLVAIVESSDDAVVSKNLDGIIQTWNKGAEKVFGYTAEEVVGRSITIVIPEDRLSEETLVLSRIRNGESIEHYETVRRRKDGRLIDISLTVSPIFDSEGRVIGASKIARDITLRKRAEQALREADRRKDEFLATLAHELRNPLAPLKNSVEYLRLMPMPGVPTEIVEMMDRQLSHLVHLVDDLLEVSRITRGAITLKRESVDLRAVLQAGLEISRPLLDAAGHRVEMALPDTPVTITGDRTRLAQVLANLLNNAGKYTPRPGVIRVSLELSEGTAVIRVTDPGIGIPPDMLTAIFEMFTQVRPMADRATGGLGIGLALVRRLVELHGGTVEAYSAGADQGSEFTVRLPLRAEAVQPLPAARRLLPSGQTARRVLVVDDNRDAAASLALLLGSLGHDVHMAHSGIEALEMAGTLRPDVVLLDIGMPGMSGLDVASALRAEPWGRSIVIVALTGWGQDADRARTAAAGFDHHLVKPVPYSALEQLLATTDTRVH